MFSAVDSDSVPSRVDSNVSILLQHTLVFAMEAGLLPAWLLAHPDATAAVVFLDFLVLYRDEKLSLDIPTLAGEYMTCCWISSCRPLNLRPLIFRVDGRNATCQNSITCITSIRMA